ncbi:MAG: hypothetical protein QOG34_264 [Frankiaceae bacterium]|jgi:hypothetical protein|nr:hypothetical protein [Frankiaceae bacterium]
MRDPFGRHARRLRRALRDDLPATEPIEAYARDDTQGDYWVLTGRELIVLGGAPLAPRGRVLLNDVVGAVTPATVGISAHVRSRTGSGAILIGAFRTPNGVTRRLAALLDPGGDEPEPGHDE